MTYCCNLLTSDRDDSITPDDSTVEVDGTGESALGPLLEVEKLPDAWGFSCWPSPSRLFWIRPNWPNLTDGCFREMWDFKLVTDVLYENVDLHMLHFALLLSSSETKKKFQISDFLLIFF